MGKGLRRDDSWLPSEDKKRLTKMHQLLRFIYQFKVRSIKGHD
jgi:hypothetical protein